MSPHHLDIISGAFGGTVGTLLGVFRFNFEDVHKLWIALLVAIITGTGSYFMPRFWRWVMSKTNPSYQKGKREDYQDTDIGKD